MKVSKAILILSLCWLISACSQDDGPKLPSVEERVEEAIDDLNDKLTGASNGWKVSYAPTEGTGVFFILMDFNRDGTVRLQSDVTANDGEFRDQTISYRIDSSQGLELIFETFGVFHYLFELEQTTFGAEFEFIFVEEQSNNLLFRSKTDGGLEPTTLVFEQAGSSDDALISTEAPAILSLGIFRGDNLANVGGLGNFNFYFPSRDHTMSMTFDLDRRKARILGIAKGQDMASIEANDNILNVGRESTFSFSNERVILDEAQQVNFDGVSYNISEIPVGNLTKGVMSFCAGQQDSIFSFPGTSQFGAYTATSSPFQVSNIFKPTDEVFGINYVFIFDENDNSLATYLENEMPGVAAFQWYYGFEIEEDSVLNALGFVIVDELNQVDFFLRGYDVVQVGNNLQLTFNGNDFITKEDPTPEELQGLQNATDLIFDGGNIYVQEIINLGLLEFYNPCNKYKGFLIQ